MIDIYECHICGQQQEYNTDDVQEHEEFEECKPCFDQGLENENP